MYDCIVIVVNRETKREAQKTSHFTLEYGVR